MSNTKLKRLFQAARQAPPPRLSEGLADEVVRAIRRPLAREVSALSVFDELNIRFAKLATAAVLILALGVAANLALGTQEVTDWNDGMAQLSAQWFLLPEGL